MAKPKSTYEILLEKHGNRYVPVMAIADLIGITCERKLRETATRQRLGNIKTFRMIDSKNAPLLVDLQTVADTLDERARLG